VQDNTTSNLRKQMYQELIKIKKILFFFSIFHYNWQAGYSVSSSLILIDLY